MTLSPEEKDNIISYRVEKSRQTFKEATDNASLGNWSLAANRLYYAVFYRVLALNLKNGNYARSHSGTFGMFSKAYIATGILSKEESNLYRNLFSMRQTGDYDDLFDWTETDIAPLIPEVKSLLSHLDSLLRN